MMVIMVMIIVVMMTTMTMIMFPLEMASSLVGSGLELADAAFQPESGGAIIVIFVIVAVINILQSSLLSYLRRVELSQMINNHHQ